MSTKGQRVRLYVARHGDDTGSGTRERPFRTLHRAMRIARELEARSDGLRVDVYVRSGCYWVHARMIPGASELLDPTEATPR